jgi:chromate reductase
LTPLSDVNFLAISGSLRATSSNTALLEAARLVSRHGVTIRLYAALAALPQFNPDFDSVNGEHLPPLVSELRALVGQADALLLSTPEYAHGLPGAFKNALDWLVGSTEFPGKPVAVVSPSARAMHAQAQLHEVLSTMSARLLDRTPIVIALPRRDMRPEEIVADRALSAALRFALEEIVAAVSATSQSLNIMPSSAG